MRISIYLKSDADLFPNINSESGLGKNEIIDSIDEFEEICIRFVQRDLGQRINLVEKFEATSKEKWVTSSNQPQSGRDKKTQTASERFNKKVLNHLSAFEVFALVKKEWTRYSPFL